MIDAAIRKRKVTLSIAVLLAVLGLLNYYINPKQENPDINAPFAVITAVYPGASPEDMERLVTGKIEERIAEIEGYSYSQSDSRNSLSVTVIRLDSDIDPDKAWVDLRQRMDDLQRELPEGCGDIEINTDLDRTAGMILSLSGDEYSRHQLAWYAEGLKRKLVKIQGISRIDIIGKPEEQVKVEVDTTGLGFYNLSMDEIAGIIGLQNIEIPSGYIDDGETRINVNMPGTYSSLEEIGSTVIGVSADSGAVARLKDIASVYIKPLDSNPTVKKDGRDAVLLAGYFNENSNIVITGRKVEKRIDTLKGDLPEGILLERVLYQPEDVGNAVGNFSRNLAIGVLLVIVVVFLGMGFRNAITVSAAIPLSILITFLVMRVWGVKIHQISISALIIALGMLVDNAIVVTDAIQVRLDSGQDRMAACVEGVKEISIPVLTSTLTTIGAFIPLLMLPSVAGEYIRSIPQIVIVSLLVSYLVALFVTPVIAFSFFRKSVNKGMFPRLRGWFVQTLKSSMKRRGTLALAVVAALVLVVFVAVRLGLQFFPKADTDMVYIDIKAEQGEDIKRTVRLAEAVSGVLEEQPEVTSYTAVTGGGLPKFYNTLPFYTKSQDFAQIMLRLNLEKGGRFKTSSGFVDHLQVVLDTRVVGGNATVKQLELGEPIGSPLRVRITGDDADRIAEAVVGIRDKLSGIRGTMNVDDDLADRKYEFRVGVDIDKAGNLGISRYDVQREVSIALRGKKASVFRKEGEEYDILVKGSIGSKEDLENLYIKSSVTGRKVILKEIAWIDLADITPYIKKYDGDRAAMVTADVKQGFSPVDIERCLGREMEDLDLQGVNIVFDGERRKIGEYFGDIGVSAAFAVLLVYGILIVQFYSFLQPLVILFTIPLSVIGSVLGLLIFRQPLSFTALLGMVSLLGIVVNNAIILMDHINSAIRKDRSTEEACIEAVSIRFRPIILTTTTTVAGLIPLVFSGSELFKPMAVALMSGLLVSTLLTLIVIPVAFSITQVEG
ncbi:MAG: efflux RND transporter permease subunit [Bacillota bacterium]|nr:efflux RND transporter permease subunit [Bacillota bacterium]MDD3297963.1 efflux RND transporter permease subunit [Bacillota bacterium]MDD3850761.1 efflux RND transporter permease subunit [Bacillota bacterium]MDD4707741.1 efflux RND transporter permease subunit [Bacillota bacterium]